MKNVKSVLYLILGLLISSLMACSDDPGAFSEPAPGQDETPEIRGTEPNVPILLIRHWCIHLPIVIMTSGAISEDSQISWIILMKWV